MDKSTPINKIKVDPSAEFALMPDRNLEIPIPGPNPIQSSQTSRTSSRDQMNNQIGERETSINQIRQQQMDTHNLRSATLSRPIPVELPTGQSQGQSVPLQYNSIFSVENFKEKHSVKLIIIVFVILLLFLSPSFTNVLTSAVPKLSQSTCNSQLNIVGTVIIAIIGTIVFQLLNLVL